MSTKGKPEPHVLVMPFPAQGHVKPMLTFSQLLCHVGIHVTFVNTEHNHRRLGRDRRDLSERFANLIRFAAVPDGLPAAHARSEAQMVVDLVASYGAFGGAARQPLRDIIAAGEPPVTCVLADGMMSFAYDIAEELGIRVVAFRTVPGCALWAYFCVPLLVQKGELPIPDKDMDEMVNGIPGMEGILRRRDLPGICRLPVDHFAFEFLVKQTQALTRTSALILNTVEALEPQALTQISSHFPSTYTIGPVRNLLQSLISLQNDPRGGSSSGGALWKEDRDCMTWLDSQPRRSVVYVSFGSLATVTRGDLLEIWHGLVSSGRRFLWVVRSDMIVDGDHHHDDHDHDDHDDHDDELQMGMSERGYLVDWAPQEEVLSHPAVGGFLTHSGWNSTLEGIVAGVPMLCWPKSVDQQVISRWVSEVWKIGLDMKDTCHRSTVEKMVRCLMEDRRDEIATSMERVSKLALDSVREGGSSYTDFEKLLEDLRRI